STHRMERVMVFLGRQGKVGERLPVVRVGEPLQRDHVINHAEVDDLSIALRQVAANQVAEGRNDGPALLGQFVEVLLDRGRFALNHNNSPVLKVGPVRQRSGSPPGTPATWPIIRSSTTAR